MFLSLYMESRVEVGIEAMESDFRGSANEIVIKYTYTFNIARKSAPIKCFKPGSASTNLMTVRA